MNACIVYDCSCSTISTHFEFMLSSFIIVSSASEGAAADLDEIKIKQKTKYEVAYQY